ncbi:MAG: acyl-CoA/acyl-ACP dehydrogenase [Pseudomonadales bacterium]|nr:acyl-CoA/acyl-ACP dehydrogenase [Pseudomonadales bacterium]
MPFTDLDLDVTDTEKAVYETAHKFAMEVMRPAGRELDELSPEEVIAQDSIFWEVQRKRKELGLNDPSGGDTSLTPIQRARLNYIVTEQMGYGDAGLAISFGVNGFPLNMAAVSGNADLMNMVKDNLTGCWAITEPNHGTDTLDFHGAIKADEYSKWDCIAVKDGDNFVLNGQKSAWVSNGVVAEAAALFCGCDMGDGNVQRAIFVIPLNLDGVSRGKNLNKIGQRALPQGEIFFDNVKFPLEYMAVPPDSYETVAHMVLCGANAGMGTIFAGVAQSALDLALEYTKERVQGGVPIFQHQSVKDRLFKMFQKVETAKALNRRVQMYNAVNTPLLEYCICSKVTSTNAAFEVASEAFGLFGGNGTSREYPIEKIFRDARSSMIEDGSNEELGLIAASRF